MIKVQMEIKDNDLLFRIRELAAGLEDTTQVNERVSIVLWEWVERNFEQQGGLDGAPVWAPFKTKDKDGNPGRWIRAGGKRTFDASAKLLQDTGQLRQSFEWFFDKDTAGVGARKYEPVQGRDAPEDLAAVHQFGSTKRNIPKRPMLPPEDIAARKALDIYNDYVVELRERSGL